MKNQHNKNHESALSVLRDEIDKIDNKIISLLAQRMDVVLRVGELKRKGEEKFFIRSSREADMIKELTKKSSGNLPKSLIISIWRKLIATANMHEQPIRIAVHNPKNIADYQSLIVEFYNETVPMRSFKNATTVVNKLKNNEAEIGIFAISSDEKWWLILAKKPCKLKVFARIPFYEKAEDDKSNKTQLVAVAEKQPEKSSDDFTLFCIEVSGEVTKAQVADELKKKGFKAKILDFTDVKKIQKSVFYLVEVKGFYLDVPQLSVGLSKLSVKIIGHYAAPIKV